MLGNFSKPRRGLGGNSERISARRRFPFFAKKGNGAAFVQDAIKFVLCAPVGANNAAKTIALGIQTPSSGTAFAKLVMYNSDGSAKTVARTWFIWCP